MMGNCQSKHEKIGLICTWTGIGHFDDQDSGSDDYEEPDRWLSSIYKYEDIVTIDCTHDQLDINNNSA